MNKKMLFTILGVVAVATAGAIAGAAYGQNLPLVDTVASKLPKSRVLPKAATA